MPEEKRKNKFDRRQRERRQRERRIKGDRREQVVIDGSEDVRQSQRRRTQRRKNQRRGEQRREI